MTNATLGRAGEDIAVAHLLTLGWHVVERNWRCPGGEVDIIAVDETGVLVFCEVKCRAGRGYGDPLEAITPAKLARLRRHAAHWLRTEPLPGVGAGHRRVRIDAIGIVKRRGYAPELTHLRGIG